MTFGSFKREVLKLANISSLLKGLKSKGEGYRDTLWYNPKESDADSNEPWVFVLGRSNRSYGHFTVVRMRLHKEENEKTLLYYYGYFHFAENCFYTDIIYICRYLETISHIHM